MNITSTGSTASTSAASSNGLSGLASGIDTESMVEQMLSGIQAKIDKANQEKQQITWKQEIYRDLISQISSFQNKYFGYSSSTDLRSQSFFDAMVAACNSDAIKVTATSSAATGNTTVKVNQLAEKASLTGAYGVSAGLGGKLDMAQLEQKVVFDVNGTEVEVDLSGASTNEEVAQTLNDALGSKGLTAKVDESGALEITGGEVRVSGKSTARGLSRLGLRAGATATVSKDGDEKIYTLRGTVGSGEQITFDVLLDDVRQTITLDMNELDLSDPAAFRQNLEDSLNEQLKKLGTTDGSQSVTVEVQADGSLRFSAPQGRTVTVTDNGSGILKAFGMENGQSNKVSVGLTLGQTAFSTPLQGKAFSFEINGVRFDFTENDTISSMMTKINNSSAGVRITYAPLEDAFTIEAANAGAGQEIVLKDLSGNLLSAMFGQADGLTSGESVTSGSLATDTIAANNSLVDSDFTVTEATMTLTVNGKEVVLSVPKREEGEYSQAEILKTLNEQLEVKFGYTTDSDGKQVQAITIDAAGLHVNDGSVVSFAKTNIDLTDQAAVEKAAQSDLALAFGFSREETTNAASGDMTLDDLGLVGLTDQNGALLDGQTKLSELADKTGGMLSFSEGRITYDSTKAGAGIADKNVVGNAAVTQKLFGDTPLQLGVAQGGVPAKTVEGKNAIVEINGVLTERSSNDFTVNGLNLSLKAVTDEAVTISTSRDTDTIVEGIKGFIEDYNKLIDTISEYTDAEATYRDYPPLTDAQRKEMSEREIELWEEKAKTGLLRGDDDLNTLLSSMRLALYSKGEDMQYALYDLGIDTSSNWRDKGKLVIEDEAKLRQRIETAGDEVKRLFTDAENGIAYQMEKALKAAANTSSGSPGSLVELAGVKGYGTEFNNTLYDRLTEINDKIESLKDSYERQKTRYWNQFNQMEQLISQMNTQSSWLAQQFSY